MNTHDRRDIKEGAFLFKFLLLANMCMYLEAGALPALLLQISESFKMSPGQQGMLGGVAYLSLGMGSPLAAFLLRKYDHKTVISYAIGFNNVCTFFWALTPVGAWYSMELFIGIRFIMGLTQCILCVYLPLWVHEFAPSNQRAKWMGALQSSVPLGVMVGYIIAAVLVGPVASSDVCFGVLCWRWPLIVEWALLLPFCVAIHCVSSGHFVISVHNSTSSPPNSPGYSASYHTISAMPVTGAVLRGVKEEADFKKIESSLKAKSFTTFGSKNQENAYENLQAREARHLLSRRSSWHHHDHDSTGCAPASSSQLCASLFSAMSPSPSRIHKGDDVSSASGESRCAGDMDASCDQDEAHADWGGDVSSAAGASWEQEAEDSEAFAPLFRHLSSSGSSSDSSRIWCTTAFQPIFVLLQIPLYRYLLCALAGLYFVVTGVQFWSTSYMILLFGDEFRPLINTMFIFCAATAPTGGVLAGSWLADELGGYCGARQRRVIISACTMSGMLGCVFATLAVQTTSFYSFVAYLWLLLFCGGSCLPASSGILVSIVPHKYRTISSSFSLMTFNIFGYFLSLCVTGYIMEVASLVFEDCNEVCAHVFGYHVILLWSFVSFFFMACALLSSPVATSAERI